MDVLQRANQLQAQGYEVLHCEVGQPETGAPRQVVQAAMDALTSPPPRSILGYTDAFGLIALRQAIAKHYQNKYGVSIDTKRIVITTGSSGAFLLAFTAAFDSGDLVAIASSGYPCYRNILGALGCTLVNIPINSQFKLTAKELLAEVHRRQEQGDKKIQGLILSSPSNPTGAMLTPTELQELCHVCEQENILFISDEIYHGITYEKEEATALLFSSRVFVINSFSKYYSSTFFLCFGIVYMYSHFFF
jgi:aspartate/methionine/tyrosine aminotransferase